MKLRYIKVFFKKMLGPRIFAWLLFSSLGGFALAALEVALAYLLQLLLISLGALPASGKLPVVLNKYSTNLGWVCAALGLLALARFFAQIVTNHSAIASQEAINHRLRAIASYDMLLNPKSDYVSAAQTMFRISELFPKAAKWCATVFSVTLTTIECVTIFVSMAILCWRETAMSVVGLSLIALVVLKINQFVRHSAQIVPRYQEKISQKVERIARNWFLIKLLRTDRREFSAIEQSISGYSSQHIRGYALIAVASSLSQFMGVALVAAIVFISHSYIHTDGVVLLSFIYLFIRFVQHISATSNNFGALVFLSTAYKETMTFVDSWSEEELASISDTTQQLAFFGGVSSGIKKRVTEEHSPAISEQRNHRQAPSIDFRAVSFVYHNDAPIPSLQALNLTVRSGEKFGIIGPSGCGKSTLLALLLGFLKPTRGTILVSGNPAEEYFKAGSVRARVGYVGAEPFLIEGSIFDNLNYGCDRSYSESDCWEALTQAHLVDEIRMLPGQLKYHLKENGMGLSAGQKQRLSLARALMVQPELLVLDEASANLDMGTEQQIAETIARLDYPCTRVIVSHRPGLIQFCDRTLVLDPQERPRIVEGSTAFINRSSESHPGRDLI